MFILDWGLHGKSHLLAYSFIPLLKIVYIYIHIWWEYGVFCDLSLISSLTNWTKKIQTQKLKNILKRHRNLKNSLSVPQFPSLSILHTGGMKVAVVTETTQELTLPGQFLPDLIGKQCECLVLDLPDEVQWTLHQSHPTFRAHRECHVVAKISLGDKCGPIHPQGGENILPHLWQENNSW